MVSIGTYSVHYTLPKVFSMSLMSQCHKCPVYGHFLVTLVTLTMLFQVEKRDILFHNWYVVS